jgi:hypothetical protein
MTAAMTAIILTTTGAIAAFSSHMLSLLATVCKQQEI